MSTILSRPVDDYPSLPNGVYDAVIESASVGKEKDYFSKDGSDRDALILKVKIFGAEKTIVLRYAPTISWNSKSNMYKMLDILGLLPERGTNFDIDILVGKKITVVIKNEIKEGISYCNIKDILPARAISPVVTPAVETSTAEPSLDD